MGTNSKTTHHSYVIAPTAGALTLTPELDEPQTELEVLDNEDTKALLDAKIKAATQQFLTNLTPEELQQLAAAQGFAYPELVGLSGSVQHPLVHWLDPAYPADSASKKKIQAAAQQRFDALCAGNTVAGKTLQQWQAAHPDLAAPALQLPATFTTWTASPAEVMAAQAHLDQVMTTLQQEGELGTAQGVELLLAAENTLATAQCAELGDTLNTIVASRRHEVDQALSTVSTGSLWMVIGGAVEDGKLPAEQLEVLDPIQLTQLLRASTTADERQSLEQLAATRLPNLVLPGIENADE